jgi:mannobiose 2-epimerase
MVAGTLTENLVSDSTADRITILNNMQRVLDNELKCWYPLSIDTVYGGFFSDINYKWELDGTQNKMIVTQARHIWSAANAAMFFDGDTVFRNIAAHGFRFLKNKMWDPELGGFYEFVNRKGESLKIRGRTIKTAYGNAFAIYGLARYFWASGDTAALELARQTFCWLEKHSYDSLYGGYFQYISNDGAPLEDGFRNFPPKDQNSSIHLLESFSELYKVWPDERLKERLSSLLQIIRDKIVSKKGYLNLFLNRDWTPVSYRDSISEVRDNNYKYDHVSFGHDVETAYLMMEASETLGIKKDSITLMVGKRMVDHALLKGWDQEKGGIYDEGYYSSKDNKLSIIRKTKEWWAQVEAFNSFLMLSEYYPQDTMEYYDKFLVQWAYCKKYLIDSLNGGWYWSGTDIDPVFKKYPKGSIWKADYHTSRALINCILRLKHKTKQN